jgi:hypothetical protein
MTHTTWKKVHMPGVGRCACVSLILIVCLGLSAAPDSFAMLRLRHEMNRALEAFSLPPRVLQGEIAHLLSSVQILYPPDGAVFTPPPAPHTIGIPVIVDSHAEFDVRVPALDGRRITASLTVSPPLAGISTVVSNDYVFTSEPGGVTYEHVVMSASARERSARTLTGQSVPAVIPEAARPFLSRVPIPNGRDLGDMRALSTSISPHLAVRPARLVFPVKGSYIPYGDIRAYLPGTHSITATLKIGDTVVATDTSTFTVKAP